MFFRNKPIKLPEELRLTIARYLDTHYEESARRELKNAQVIAEALPLEDACIADGKGKRPVQACATMAVSRSQTLADMLKGADAGFTETLLQMIDATGKKDSEIYKRAGLTKQHFSKIRNNPEYKPTKPTAVALALALELDLEKTRDLIGRAGYALSNSSKFDLIIRYFLEQGKYDLMEINMALYEFDQPLLGA